MLVTFLPQLFVVATLAFGAPADGSVTVTAQPAADAPAPALEPATPAAEPAPTPDLSDPFAGGQQQQQPQPAQPQPALSDPFVSQPPADAAGTVAYAPPPPSVEPDPQPHAQEKPRKIGFFVGFDTRLSEIDRAFGTTLGGSAGLILFNRLMVGGAGYSLVFHDRSYQTLNDTRELALDYGGVLLGAFALRSPRVDGGFNVFLGGGQLCMDSNISGSCVAKTSAFVSHIESNIYIRIAPILRLALGLGYNFIVDTTYEWAGPDNWAMSGWSGSVKLEFGLFGGPKRGR